MNPYLVAVLWSLLEFGMVGVPVFAYYRRGYQRGRMEGYKAGYELGRIDAEKWFLEQGRAVDQERAKIQEERWP